jgi:hypothetical protein
MRRLTRVTMAAAAGGALALGLVAAPAFAEVQRETVVQEYPGDLPTEDRNIVCANDPAAPDFNSYQYWFTGGRSVFDVSTVTTGTDDEVVTIGRGQFEDVTAIRSDDDAVVPRTYQVDGSAVVRVVERGSGSTLSITKIYATIVDAETGLTVDLVDNATIDRGDGAEFIFNRGDCG